LPESNALDTNRQTFFTQVVFSAAIAKEIEHLAQRSGATLFSTLLTCWLMVMIANDCPVDRIGIPWSERPIEGMYSSIGNHIRMLVLKGSVLLRGATGNGGLVFSFQEALDKIQSALQEAAQELLMCTADSAPDVGYDLVFAWDFEGGGWLEAANVASQSCNFLHIPQGAHPGAVSALSLWCSGARGIEGWLQSNSAQDQSLLIQEFIATCHHHSQSIQL